MNKISKRGKNNIAKISSWLDENEEETKWNTHENGGFLVLFQWNKSNIYLYNHFREKIDPKKYDN